AWSCVFSSGRGHTRWKRDWSSDMCSSDLPYSRESGAVERASASALSRRANHSGVKVKTSVLLNGAPPGRGRRPCPVPPWSILPRSEERRVGGEWRAGVAREERKGRDDTMG